jgi:hypothetical protein
LTTPPSSASLGPGPEFPPGDRTSPDEPERCDFCTTRTLRLAGAKDFPLPEPLKLLAVEINPLQVAPGLAGLELKIQPTTIQAGQWSACTVCAPVVALRDAQLLADHVMAEWVKAGKLATLADRTQFFTLYQKLLPALGGPHPHIPEGAV